MLTMNIAKAAEENNARMRRAAYGKKETLVKARNGATLLLGMVAGILIALFAAKGGL